MTSFRVLAVALTLAATTSAGLLIEAVRAERRHRALAEEVVRDYARSAGWLFATAYRSDVEAELLSGLGPALGWPAEPARRDVVSVREVERWASSSALCPGRETDERRFYFALDLAARVVHTAGAEPPDDLRAWLRDSVPHWAAEGDGTLGIRSHGAAGATRRVLVFAVQRDRAGSPTTVLGFDTCQGWLLDRLGGVLRRHRLLPPFLVGDSPSDSLLSVVATRARTGDTVYRTPVQYPVVLAAATRSVGLTGLVFTVAINPTVAPRLVVAGAPRSRWPWLASLLAVMAASFGVLVMQLRERSRLARTQSDFVASVSHEIRTPLAQILLFGESLKYGTAGSPAKRRFAVDVIVNEASRLIHLAENVLHFSISASGPPPALEVLPLAPLVRQAVAAFEPLARHRRVEFALELDDALAVPVDPAALNQVLINLLGNAVKFGPERQRITLSLCANDGHALLAVADRGPGIPAAGRRVIWEPFIRLAADARRAPGTGIGLTVVRDLVRRMGGDVWVEDRAGGGARFVVRLPLALADGPA